MSQPLIEKPNYFDRYSSLVEGDVVSFLKSEKDRTSDFYLSIPLEKQEYRYQDNKWTIKEIVQHISDTERVFQYRALQFARSEQPELVGFDQDVFASNVAANEKDLGNLLKEFQTVRDSSISLFDSFTEEDMKKLGTASTYVISVKNIGKIICGHAIHHESIIVERYL